MEDQVYNGIDDYLRYVRRWVKPLRHAADRELDQGVRLGGLEPVAGAPLRARDRAQGLGAGDRTPSPGGFSVAAYDSAIRGRRAAPTSAATSPASPATCAEWRTDEVFREGTLYPDVPRQGSLPLDGQAADRSCSTTRPSSCCGCTPAAGAAVVVEADGAARASPPGWRWSAGSAASAAADVVSRLDFSRDGGRHGGAAAQPGPLRPDHRGACQRRRQRRRASAPGGSTGTT